MYFRQKETLRIPANSIIIAPEEMLARALNGNPLLQQLRILSIAGIRSGVLEHAGPRLPRCEEGLGLPSKLWTLLEENHRSILIVEHRAYKRAGDMAGHIAQAMKQASREHPPIRPCIGPARGTKARARRQGLLLLLNMQGQDYSQGGRILEEMASQTTSFLMRWPWWRRQELSAKSPLSIPARD